MMTGRWLVTAISTVALLCSTPAVYGGSDASTVGNAAMAEAISPQQLDQIIPGHTTQADMRSVFGPPWRVVQFNDCGKAMDDQADEIWEYRGQDMSGMFRLHVEFDDHGVVHLAAKIPDSSPGGRGTVAKVVHQALSHGMSM
jgi:hypothetical protein